MSRRGRPRDNPQAESFFRTLKLEQVYLTEYLDFADAYHQLSDFIEDVYNRKWLHSQLGYLPPLEFEAAIGHESKGHRGRSTLGALSPERPVAPRGHSRLSPRHRQAADRAHHRGRETGGALSRGGGEAVAVSTNAPAECHTPTVRKMGFTSLRRSEHLFSYRRTSQPAYSYSIATGIWSLFRGSACDVVSRIVPSRYHDRGAPSCHAPLPRTPSLKKFKPPA